MVAIGFATNKKLYSRLIRWAIQCPYSHVWLEYPSTLWAGQWAAHATEGGVRKEALEQAIKRYPKHVAFESKIVLQPGMMKARNLLGKKYDYKVIWHAILLVLYRTTGWKFLWRLVIRDMRKLTCSEFVSIILKGADVPGAERLDPELVSPADLYEFVRHSPHFELRE